MKGYVRLGIVFGVAMLAAAVIVLAVIQLGANAGSLSESEQAKAYACGYVAGQNSIMREMPAIFPDHKDNHLSFCDGLGEIARRHGFAE